MTTKKSNPWSAKAKKKDNPWTAKAREKGSDNPLVLMMKAKRENPNAVEIARLDKQIKEAGVVLDLACRAEKVAFDKLDKFDSTKVLARKKATDRYREVKEEWVRSTAKVDRAQNTLLGLLARRRRLDTNGSSKKKG